MSVQANRMERVVSAAVKSLLGDELVEAAGMDSPLMGELGLDSLELAQLLDDLGRRLGVELSIPALSRHLSAQDAAASAPGTGACPAQVVRPLVGAVTIRALVRFASTAGDQAVRVCREAERPVDTRPLLV